MALSHGLAGMGGAAAGAVAVGGYVTGPGSGGVWTAVFAQLQVSSIQNPLFDD